MSAPTVDRDLSEIPTPQEIGKMLIWLNRNLRDAAGEIRRLDEATARAKVTYVKVHAKAFIDAQGSMDLRRRLAEVQSADALLAYELAEVELRGAKERIKTLYSQVESTRSLNALARAEAGLAGAFA